MSRKGASVVVVGASNLRFPLWTQIQPAAAVLHIDLRPHVACETSALAWLDAEERARWQGYLHLGERRRYVLCRATLRMLLCERLACQNTQLSFAASQHGKPFALVDGTAAAVSFNISHSGWHGLIAIAAAGRLGVDVEAHTTRRDLTRLAESATVFTPQERAALAKVSGADKRHLFYRLWTIKEALSKALGKGLTIGLAELTVPVSLYRVTTSTTRSLPLARSLQLPHEPTATWHIECIGNADFAAAVAQELV